MIIRGVLLGTVEEQRKGGDQNPIDPEKVELFEDGHVPVSVNFDLTKTFGKVQRVWRANGRIMFEADVNEHSEHLRSSRDPEGRRSALQDTPLAAFGGTIDNEKGTKIFGISLTDANENRDQPPWEEVT